MSENLPGPDHLDALENQSVYIIREAYRKFRKLAMLWSIDKADKDRLTVQE